MISKDIIRVCSDTGSSLGLASGVETPRFG